MSRSFAVANRSHVLDPLRLLSSSKIDRRADLKQYTCGAALEKMLQLEVTMTLDQLPIVRIPFLFVSTQPPTASR